MTCNNQILSFKTIFFINESFFLIFVEMELEPCNFFNAPYMLEICHVMILSSTCEMKSIAYHNIVHPKYVNNPFNLNKTSLQLYCH
jgi:hypothetical protein